MAAPLNDTEIYWTPVRIDVSKRKPTPRFFWEWSHMHKQLIPGHFSPPTRPEYETSDSFY